MRRRGLYFSPCSSRLKKLLCRGRIPTILHENVEHDPVLVHRPPEIVQHAVDPDEHLIKVPGVSGPGPPPSEPSGELRTKFPAPVPDALVGHDHAALGQDQLDVPQTEAEYMIQPDRVADDLGREAMPRIGGGLWRHPVSLARFPSGHQLPLSWRCHPGCYQAQRGADGSRAEASLLVSMALPPFL